MSKIKILIILSMMVILGQTVYAIKVDEPVPASSNTTISTKTTSGDENVKFFYDSKGKSDPMDLPWLVDIGTPQTTSDSGIKKIKETTEINIEEVIKFKLSGIIYSEDNPVDSYALISGKIVKAGQVVNIPGIPKSVKINKIKKNELFILYENKNYTIKISAA